MLKIIILVGGTDFSGTTVLDLCLSSTKGGFSLGEVHAWFWKTSGHHEKLNCWCSNPDCEVWSKVDNNDISSVYASVSGSHSSVEYLVDSSKNLRWFNTKKRECERQELKVKVVLIWKSANDFVKSCKKRGRERLARLRWVSYNLAFLWRFPQAFLVHYNDLICEPERVLKELCEYVEIDYDREMLNYGRTEHHTLYGSRVPRRYTELYGKSAVSRTNVREAFLMGTVYRYVEKKLEKGTFGLGVKVFGGVFFYSEVIRNYIKVKLYKLRHSK